MLALGSKRLSLLRTTRVGGARRSNRPYTEDVLKPLIKRPAVGKHGLCGLDVYRPSDINKLVKEVVEECGRKVAVLERYEESTPSEVRSNAFHAILGL